jgi:hypothetical protein
MCLMKRIIIIVLLVSAFSIHSSAQKWVEVGTGTNALNANDHISCIQLDQSGNIYATGSFTDSIWYYVAKWNGKNWNELGNLTTVFDQHYGINNLLVDSAGHVCISGTGVYYDLVEWTGSSWEGLHLAGSIPNTGTYRVIDSIGITNPIHYSSVQRKTNVGWIEINSNHNALNLINPITSTANDDKGNSYAICYFNYYNNYGAKASYVGKWNGSSWDELGAGTNSLNANNRILSIAADNYGNVYAAGNFTDSSGYAYVAKWNGTSWNILGSGLNTLVDMGQFYSLAVDKAGTLFATGDFIDDHLKYYVATWEPGNAVTTSNIFPVDVNTLSIYPNPGNGLVQIKSPEDVQLQAYNLLGESITSQSIYKGTTTVDLSNIASGMYWLVFSGQNVSYEPVKWIKE